MNVLMYVCMYVAIYVAPYENLPKTLKVATQQIYAAVT